MGNSLTFYPWQCFVLKLQLFVRCNPKFFHHTKTLECMIRFFKMRCFSSLALARVQRKYKWLAMTNLLIMGTILNQERNLGKVLEFFYINYFQGHETKKLILIFSTRALNLMVFITIVFSWNLQFLENSKNSISLT